MPSYLSLLLAIVCEVIATSSLKASESFTKLVPSILTIVGYLASFYLLSMTLKTMPVGVAYAVWSGVGIVLVSLVGYFFFSQRLDAAAIAGMVLIVLGVGVIQLFSEASAH